MIIKEETMIIHNYHLSNMYVTYEEPKSYIFKPIKQEFKNSVKPQKGFAQMYKIHNKNNI